MEVRYVIGFVDDDAAGLTVADVDVEGNATDADRVDDAVVAEMDGNRNVEPGV